MARRVGAQIVTMNGDAAAGGPGQILWLASYPKSGNTWVRLFLANLLGPGDAPARINEIDRTPMAAGRDLFEDVTGLESSELAPDETLRLRRDVFHWVSQRADGVLPCKIHDAFIRLPDGRPMIDPAVTFGALYILRNPLDVAVSLRHHLGLSADAVIDRMADDAFRIGGRGRPQLRQPLGTWSAHVTGWLSAPGIPVMVTRYEDLSALPADTFARVAAFSGSDVPAARIGRAIEFSSFAEARRQEDEGGFIERPAGAERFFRVGRVGSWRDDLTPAQVDRLVESHFEVMRRFDYVDGEGRPVP
ncbi:MAG: sulfotransferase domain-containing protein [Longimicrobiales bacterium]